jgi:uncharacterized protein
MISSTKPMKDSVLLKGTSVVIQPTTFCNIACRYCYLPDKDRRNKITVETLEAIFTQVFSSKLVRDPVKFIWHASEPLTLGHHFYESVFELCENVSQKFGRSYRHSLQTNATLINDAWVSLFQQHSVGVGISIDGPAFIHDQNRVTRSGKGTHSMAMSGIRKLQEANVDFGTISVLTSFSLKHPEEMWKFFMENEITSIGFNIEEAEGNNTQSSCSNSSIEDYKSFIQRFLKVVSESSKKVRIREFERIYKQILMPLSDDEIKHDPNVPLAIINFDYHGNYSTFSPELIGINAASYQNLVMGNVLEDSLDDILQNAVFQRVNQEVQEGVNLCKRSCEYWQFCGGGDPSNKLAEAGRFDVSETLTCRLSRKSLVDSVLCFLEEIC